MLACCEIKKETVSGESRGKGKREVTKTQFVHVVKQSTTLDAHIVQVKVQND